MNIKKRFAMAAAAAAIAGGLTLGGFGSTAIVSAQASTPQTRADCANWRTYGFSNRAACVAFVVDNNANGYGGNGGGDNGTVGSIGRLIRTVINAIAQVFRAIFAFIF